MNLDRNAALLAPNASPFSLSIGPLTPSAIMPPTLPYSIVALYHGANPLPPSHTVAATRHHHCLYCF